MRSCRGDQNRTPRQGATYPVSHYPFVESRIVLCSAVMRYISRLFSFQLRSRISQLHAKHIDLLLAIIAQLALFFYYLFFPLLVTSYSLHLAPMVAAMFKNKFYNCLLSTRSVTRADPLRCQLDNPLRIKKNLHDTNIYNHRRYT